MAYFLAVDVGGTKTDYILADDTQTLGRVRTGTIKRMRTSADIAQHNLHSALQQLTAITGVSIRAITRTCVGTAGNLVPLVADWLRTELTSCVGGDLILVGDIEIALDAALFGKRGVLVLAGTGSNVAARSSGGQIRTVGGWGPSLADQGSGHAIGQHALRNVFAAIDEERECPLLGRILALWQLDSLSALVEYANGQPGPDFSALSGVVIRCAIEGDMVATETLRQAGRDLASMASLVIRKIQRLEPESMQIDLPSVAVAGSILQRIELVRLQMEESLHHVFPKIKILSTVVDPVLGALWRARTGEESNKPAPEVQNMESCCAG